jgi:hypothetical protein
MKQLLAVLERYKTMDITAIIVSVVSLIGTIIAGILQFRKLKSEANNLDTSSTSNLVKLALEINKQDLDTLRTVNNDLKTELKDREAEIIKLRDEVSILRKEKLVLENQVNSLSEDVHLLKLNLECMQGELENLRKGEK